MIKSKTISIKGNSYEVKFPNVGQFIDIEILKSNLSKGSYGQLMSNASMASLIALDVIDAEAYLTILIPAFKKDLKVNSFGELSLEDVKEVLDVFKEEIYPFIIEINSILIPKQKEGENKSEK